MTPHASDIAIWHLQEIWPIFSEVRFHFLNQHVAKHQGCNPRLAIVNRCSIPVCETDHQVCTANVKYLFRSVELVGADVSEFKFLDDDVVRIFPVPLKRQGEGSGAQDWCHA